MFRKPGEKICTGPPGTSIAMLSPSLPPNGVTGSFATVGSSTVGISYVEFPI